VHQDPATSKGSESRMRERDENRGLPAPRPCRTFLDPTSWTWAAVGGRGRRAQLSQQHTPWHLLRSSTTTIAFRAATLSEPSGTHLVAILAYVPLGILLFCFCGPATWPDRNGPANRPQVVCVFSERLRLEA
jgi:hypothetical protein